MTAAAHELAEWATGLGLADIPAQVQEKAVLHILDALGSGIAGLALGEVQEVRGVAEELGGPPQATALGIEGRLGAGAAAFANAGVIHALDYDDTHDAALVHSSAVVAPVAIACGEAWDAPGEEVLAAAIAGFEISSRIGLAGAGRLHVRGFHPTSVCGVFAAAAIAARLRGLGAGGVANAMGIAGSFSSGLLEFLSDGSQTKPFHPAWASLGGIVASGLAARGGTGPATVLEGRFGLLRTHLDDGEFDESRLIAGLGSVWETARIAIKPYPACHCTHTVLDSLAGIVRAEGIGAGDVAEVVCHVPSPVAVELVLEPAARKRRPSGAYDAKFSLPYCVASLLVRGTVGVDSFTDAAVAEPEVLAVADRVRYDVRDFPGGNADLAGGVTVRTRAGAELSAETLFPRGGSDSPMSADDIRDKFRRNARLALPEDAVEALDAAVARLGADGARPVAALLAQAGRVVAGA